MLRDSIRVVKVRLAAGLVVNEGSRNFELGPRRMDLPSFGSYFAIRYRCVSLRTKIDPPATAIDASVRPSI